MPFVGTVWGCDLAGDPLDPDTYAISVMHINDGKVMGPDEIVVTHDAGRTWLLEAMPADMLYSCATLPLQLHMPTWVQALPCVIAPLVPTHLYAIVATSATVNQGSSLYETRNSGTSWRLLHSWPTATGSTQLMEIHPTGGGLYVVDGQDSGGEGVYRSADGGATWRKLPLKAPLNSVTYFGARGRLLATALPHLYQVNPVTGAATPLGDVPVTQEDKYVGGVISAVAICEGSQPSLVVSGPYGTCVRSLPPLEA